MHGDSWVSANCSPLPGVTKLAVGPVEAGCEAAGEGAVVTGVVLATGFELVLDDVDLAGLEGVAGVAGWLDVVC